MLTAITRPINLPQLAESIAKAMIHAKKDDEIVWHWKFDWNHEFPGGQQIKNDMLDGITDGWVCILDDDTIMSPYFFRSTHGLIHSFPTHNAFVFSQRRNTGSVLRASPSNLFVGGIDAGQVLLRRSFIGTKRIPLHYCGDGEFLSELLTNAHGVHYSDSVLSAHNVLRPESP